MMNKVASEMTACELIMYMVRWCICHQLHLIVKQVLATLEAFEWDGDAAIGFKYFNGVSAVAGVWRSTGIATRLHNKAAKLYDDSVALAHFKKIPGRPLKGRWGAVDSIELIIRKALIYIARVFAAVFKYMGAGKEQATKSGPGEEDDQKFQKEQRTCRLISVIVVNKKPFLALVIIISSTVKASLHHCLLWVQKAKKEMEPPGEASGDEGTSIPWPHANVRPCLP